MLTAFGILVLVFALMVGWDYLPRPEKQDVKQAKSALAHSKQREAAATNKLRDAEQELEHTHRLVVSTDAPLKRDSLTYEFGRRHLDTTNIDSLNAQIKRADSVVVDQRAKIAALEKDTASKAHVIIEQRALIAVKDEKYASLEKLNKAIAAQIPTTRQRLTHDAKVAGLTAAAIGALQFIVQARK